MSRMACTIRLTLHTSRPGRWLYGPVVRGAFSPSMSRALHWSVRWLDNKNEDPMHKPSHESEVTKASSTSHELVEANKSMFDNYPRSLRELALKARSFTRTRTGEAANAAQGSAGARPSAPRHTPTQEDLLRIARGFWTRMRIRFKWFTIRSFRRFNIDEISAFFTLGGLGTAIWVIVGTYVWHTHTSTTFVSVIFAALNLLNLQGTLDFPLIQNTLRCAWPTTFPNKLASRWYAVAPLFPSGVKDGLAFAMLWSRVERSPSHRRSCITSARRMKAMDIPTTRPIRT